MERYYFKELSGANANWASYYNNYIDMLDKLKQLKANATQGEWYRYYPMRELDQIRTVEGDVIVAKEETIGNVQYIVALHNNAEELIRMAEAGQALAEAMKSMDIKDFEPTDSDGGYRTGVAENNQRLTVKEAVGYAFANLVWRAKRDGILDTYNKTIDEENAFGNPTFYDTITSSEEWHAWIELQEQTMEFDVHESTECGWLSEVHWKAFLQWIASK